MITEKLIPTAFALGLSLSPICVLANTDALPRAEANVPYSAVTELSFQAADQRLNYGNDPLQFIDLWQAPNAAAPLVIFIHGGCWLNAYDIQHTRAASSALQAAGYAVASIEYRRTGDAGGGWPGTWHDIQHAVETLIAVPELSFEQRQVIIMGHSAGGHLALLAGNAFADSIDHVVGLAAITDLATYVQAEGGCQQAGAQFMQAASESDWQDANPIVQDVKLDVTLLQGGADTIVSPQQAASYEKSSAVEVVLVEAAGHFDWVHPHTDAWQQLLTTLEKINADN